MYDQVSNRKQLVLLLFLGVFLAPALGILPTLLAPPPKNAGAEQGLRTADVAFPAVFLAIGAVITCYAARRCPDHFTFRETLTVHYLFHQRVFHLQDIVKSSTRHREATVGGLHSGTVPMTVTDASVSILLTDGSRLTWVGSRNVVAQFTFAFRRWSDGESTAVL